MDVLIADLSKFTTSIDVTENGKIFILSGDAEVIGLPRDERFTDIQSRNEYTLKTLADLDIPLLNMAIKKYRENSNVEKYISYQFENNGWWAGVESGSIAIGMVT